jgi:hypothetical protein
LTERFQKFPDPLFFRSGFTAPRDWLGRRRINRRLVIFCPRPGVRYEPADQRDEPDQEENKGMIE